MPISHRLFFLPCLLLFVVPARGDKAKAEKRKGPPMTERILFQTAPTVEWLKGLKTETLGRIPKGTWLAADDATSLELLKRDKTTLALYPTRAEYIEAMEGLAEDEKTEAIKLRLALVEGNPRTESIPDWFFFERDGLEAIAIAMAGGAVPLEAAYKGQVDVLLNLNGSDPYRGQDKLTLLNGAFGDLNRLNWEEEALRRHPGVNLPPLDPALDRTRKDLALEIQRAERSLGVKYDHEPTGRVLDRLERGVFAKPFDERVVRGIHDGHEPVQKWKDGFVAIWGEYQLGQVPMVDKEKTILFFDADHALGIFLGLTPSQRMVAFGRQSKVAKSTDASTYLARLKAVAALELLGRRAPIAKFNPTLADRFAKQGELELQDLRSFLATQKPWTRSAGKPIRQVLEASLKEMDFWAAWAAAKFWSEDQDRIQGLKAAKAKVLAALPKDL